MRLGFFVCLVFVLIGMAPSLAADDDADSPVHRAQMLFNAEKYRDAIAILDPYLTSHPRDARALVLRGDAKASVDDDHGALADYNVAIDAAPDYEYAYRTRCETRLQLDDDDGALSDCDIAIKLDATDDRAFEDRGDVYEDRSSYDLALEDYDQAEKLGDTSVYLYAARCNTTRFLHKLERAGMDCAKSLVLAPDNRNVLWANGRLAIATGRYADAIVFLNHYIDERPNNSNSAHYWRATALTRSGNGKDALVDLNLYTNGKPSDGDDYRELGFAHAAVGDRANASADLITAARLYRRDGDEEKAQALAPYVHALQEHAPLPPFFKP